MPDPQQDTQPQMSAQEFAAAIRAKYPRVYDNLSDTDLTGRILEKHPEYRSVTGLDDPGGNYDFGELGKAQGMRANGRPATRKEAYDQLSKNRGFAQTMGETFQNKRQDVSNYVQSMTDTDQATKAYMGDLAQMLVLSGASKLGQAGRLAKAPLASSMTRKMMPESMGSTPKNMAAFREREFMPVMEGPTQPGLEEQTSPTAFREFGANRRLPVTDVAMPRKPAATKPILTPQDAAAAREAATAAKPAMRTPTETMGPKPAAEVKGAEPAVPEMRAPELPAGSTTADVYKDPATGGWKDERSQLHDRVIDKALTGHQPAPADRQPVIWVLGGGTASGKTTISRQLLADDPNLVRLDPDEMKLSIPEYEGLKTSDPQKASFRVHDESSYVNKKALARAIAKRFDIIYDTTTSGDPASKAGLIQALKGHGYKVNLAFSDVPVETAIERSDHRALTSTDPINRGRFIPHDVIRQIHSQVARNFEAFKDAADAAYLYENSRSVDQGGPQLVYSREGNAPETVHIPELYERFKQKGASLAGQATKPEPATAAERMAEPGSLPELPGRGGVQQNGGAGKEVQPVLAPPPDELNPYYGKTRQIGMETPSDLPANRRQLFGPTASTAPNPTPPRQNIALVPKMGMTKEDLAFQDANTEDILTASIGQQRMGMRTPRPGPTLVVRPPQVVQGSSVSKPMAAAELKPGDAGYVRTSELAIDPKRFQYKAAGEEGVTNLLKDVRKFDPEKAGVIQVWRDPSDGKMYVVNGHHRFELAKRTGTPSLLVKHIDASTAAKARAIGAATNIAEGRGSATDAAKFFRDTNFTPADLAKQGLSLGEGKVAEGLALSKLEAAAASEGEELSRRLVAPPKSISGAAGEIERGFDLFRGAEAGGQSEMFGKIPPMGAVERKRKAK